MRWLVVALPLLAACDKKPAATGALAPTAEKPAKTLEGPGREVVEKFQCNRCHVVPGVEPVPVNKDCRGCHRAIITRKYPAEDEYLEKWDRALTTMRDVPSLTAIDRRFRRDWFVSFLREPHDLRPRLGATMPRIHITEGEAEALADSLGLRDPAAVEVVGDVERGRELAESNGCGSCHVMTGLSGGLVASNLTVPIRPETLARSMLIAPDLRYTRERFRPDALVAWLKDPPAMKRDSLMPNLNLSEQDATDLAAFIMRGPLGELPAAAPAMKRPEPIGREVRWEEVRVKLIDQICQHCHTDPAYDDGDGGPGNTGGLGFEGKRVDFSTHQRAVYGADGGDEPLPIWRPNADGTPRIVAHLLARHEEVAGRPGELRGMPLGFPPIEGERIQLLDSWIRQGMPE